MEDKFLFTGQDPSNLKIEGEIVHYPLISTEAVDFQVTDIDSFSGFIFTSRGAVKAFCSRYKIASSQKIFAVGPHTAKELKWQGYKIDFMPDIPNSDELCKIIQQEDWGKLLYPTSDIADNKLSSLGNVVTLVAYKTVEIPQQRIDFTNFKGVIFTSPSTINTFLNIYNKIPPNLKLLVYGKKSAERLGKLGYGEKVEILDIC